MGWVGVGLTTVETHTAHTASQVIATTNLVDYRGGIISTTADTYYRVQESDEEYTFAHTNQKSIEI